MYSIIICRIFKTGNEAPLKRVLMTHSLHRTSTPVPKKSLPVMPPEVPPPS